MTPAQVWNFIRPDGLTAEQALVALHAHLLAMLPADVATAVWNKTLP